ncbi:MAG: guanylate kinase [Verrucomicrobiota bacterium]
MKRFGVILLISGASGTGKTTVRDALVATVDNLHFSVSCTTRKSRDGEVEGRDYHFLSPEAFEARARAGEFLEYATVHENRYGTLRCTVEESIRAGKDVLLDIDVQGARQILNSTRETWLAPLLCTVFIAPPSLEELEKRLLHRGTDDPEVIRVRLANARQELQAWPAYQYRVVNDEVNRAAGDLQAILRAARCRTTLLQSKR